MTPTKKAQINEHVQAIARILYADADKSQLTNLGQIEAGIRAQLQEHVGPQVGVFYHSNYGHQCRIRPHPKKYFRSPPLERETRSSLRGCREQATQPVFRIMLLTRQCEC